MKFLLIPKYQGQQWSQLELSFDGSRDEAYHRAKEYVGGLRSLFRKDGFTLLIRRTDADGPPYEIDDKGHTV